MSDWTKQRLDLAADWAERGPSGPDDIDLASGETRRVQWAGKTLRLRLRPGEVGPRLELLPSFGSRVVSAFVLVFLFGHWVGFGGAALSWLIRSIQAEVPNPLEIAGATLANLALSLIYVPVLRSISDDDWSFEAHRARRRTNLLGLCVRERTYDVRAASSAPDRLVLRTGDYEDVVDVRPSGWGSETEDTLMPPELRRTIRRYLALPEDAR